MTNPARAARRQLLIDRWTEKLHQAGYPNPTERARDLLTDMDDLGFSLPPALEDTPPPRGPGHTPAARATAMQTIRDTLTARKAHR